MSRNSRSKRKKLRDLKKKARKAAQNAKYEKWRALGINTKSKRQKLNKKRDKRHSGFDHPDGRCWNIGCKKCNPQPYNQRTPIFISMSARLGKS